MYLGTSGAQPQHASIKRSATSDVSATTGNADAVTEYMQRPGGYYSPVCERSSATRIDEPGWRNSSRSSSAGSPGSQQP